MTLSSDDPVRLNHSHQDAHSNQAHFPDAANSEQPAVPAKPIFEVHKIAIIGAGPSGLAAAKHLLAQGQGNVFRDIDIFEQRGEVGGVWLHTPWVTARDSGQEVRRDGRVLDEVPLTNPFVGVDEPAFLPQPGIESSDVENTTVSELDGAGDGKASTITNGEEAETSKRSGMTATMSANPLFPSPMYDELNTNIPHTLMQFSDQAFPEDCEIYPTRQIVQDYLVEYARNVRHLIKFATQVIDVSLITAENEQAALTGKTITEKWRVKTRNLLTNCTTSAVYDAVVVASGHYATPYVPDIPGIREFHAAYPDVVAHSKSYRSPHDPGYDCSTHGARKVVVVGNSASGLDIAGQIRKARAGGEDKKTNKDGPAPVIACVQSPTPEDMRRFIEEDQGFVYDEAAPIARFLVEGKGLEFADGRVEYGVDRVLFATGYLYTFPFLNQLSPGGGEGHRGSASIDLSNGEAAPSAAPTSSVNSVGPSECEISESHSSDSNSARRMKPLITNGRRIHNLAKHFLHTSHPTLVFPGLPIKVIPFPFAEAQAAVFSRIWANVIPLPPQEVLDQWEREPEEAAQRKYAARAAKVQQQQQQGEIKKPELDEAAMRAKTERGYHVFDTGTDGRYINDMAAWVAQFDRDVNSSGGGGDGNSLPSRATGKKPPFWNEELLWQRTIFAQARIAFEKDGRKAKTLEELGFMFPGEGKWQSSPPA